MGCGVAQNIGGVVPKSLVKPARQAREIKSQECLKWRQQHRPQKAKAFPSLVRLLFSKIMNQQQVFDKTKSWWHEAK